MLSAKSGSRVMTKMIRRLTAWTGMTKPVAPWKRAHNPLATEEDVFYCFRLVLGRSPNREEWPGHSSRTGLPLAGVVTSYLNSLEFSWRNLLHTQSAAAIEAVERVKCEGFAIYVAKDDAAVGRHVRANCYEPEVQATFRRFLKPGMGVLDIGANIGYFTMLSAQLVGPSGFVMAVEPNPDNMKLLEASRRANGFSSVRTVQMAAGRDTGLLVLNTSHSNGTTCRLSDDLANLLTARTVPCCRLDDLVPAGQRIDFIKIDVEGAEYNALTGCLATITRHRPIIVSEFSPSLLSGISGIDGVHYLQFLLELGYHLSVIEANGAATFYGTEIQKIMAVHEVRGTDHIDLLAQPAGTSHPGN